MHTKPPTHTSGWLSVFWRTLKRVDKGKLNTFGMALRNSAAVALPLGICVDFGHPLIGVAIATGALNVAFSDGRDPYAQRGRRMLLWSVLGAAAVFLGSVTGNYHVLAILVASGWAVIAGLMVAISTRAGDLGLNTLVTLIVYAARGALSPKGAFYAALLVLGGGLLQTAFALLSWPFRRNFPERRAIGGVYLDLAGELERDSADVFSAPLKQPSAQIQDTLSALGRDHSVDGERFRLLYDQAERLRFSFYAVRNLRPELAREANDAEALTVLDRLLHLSCEILSAIGQALIEDDLKQLRSNLSQGLEDCIEGAHTAAHANSFYVEQFANAADVLAGQLRIAIQLACSSTTTGELEFAQLALAPPLKLQMRSWLATLRANLSLDSTAFRHAMRLAICVAIANAIGRSINTERNYWLAMTVAVVLKPDFSSTISRGVLRLAGTFAGLLLATICYHVLPSSGFTQLLLVGIFTFFLRYAGSANYGLLSISISGLIVFLIATTGVPPFDVIGQRAVNTAAGGIFALIAYALWPTWERSQLPEVLAEMLDRSREYFRAVVLRCQQTGEDTESDLDRTRRAWRQARTSAEASADRVSAEPGTDPARLDALTSILASSHAFTRATMELEASLLQTACEPAPTAFHPFARDIEFMLYYLAAALRGSATAAEVLPSLREDHRRLFEAVRQSGHRDTPLLIETDRLTVNLNTLREQVMRFIARTESIETAHTTIE